MKSKSENYQIAAIDLGKTNKKITVFSSDLKLLEKKSTQIDEIQTNGIAYEDTDQLKNWLFTQLKQLSSKHPIQAVSTTTFGATAALLSADQKLVMPVVCYSNQVDSQIYKNFYQTFGDPEKLYLETGTPEFGQLLIVGIQMFWLKQQFPKQFQAAKNILFYPQYVAHLLTGKYGVEPTYAGCHNYLYDFQKKQWSSVARRLGVAEKLPGKFSHPWTILGKVTPEISAQTGLPKSCQVTVGIHDSNSSLLPYLLVGRKRFVLASTGTWNVLMYPGSRFEPLPGDLKKGTVYYLDALGRATRSAIFKGGEEHDHYSDLIQEKLKTDPRKIKPNVKTLTKILKEAKCFVIPTLSPGSGQFPNSKARIVGENEFFSNPETAYHALNLSLVIQSAIATAQAVSGKEELENFLKSMKEPIYVEGGFRNNLIYLQTLATLFPATKVYRTDVAEATSLGAAICAKCGHEGISPDKIDSSLFSLNAELIGKLDLNWPDLMNYTREFVRHAENGG